MRSALPWLVAAPWLAWAALRTFGLDAWHPLVSLVAFTPYAAATAIVPVAVAAIGRSVVPAVLSAIAMVALVVAVAPRAIGWDGGAPSEMRQVTVMSANLRYGEADPEAVLRLARDERVEAISLQELTPGWLERFRAAGSRRTYPLEEVTPREGSVGLGVVSGRSFPRGVEVVPVHPVPPISRRRVREWRDVLEALPPASDRVWRILAGDFNATLDHTELRGVLDRGYADAAERTGEGLKPTWPVGWARPPITIDHVLADERISVAGYETHEIDGTDHRALIVRLALPSERPS